MKSDSDAPWTFDAGELPTWAAPHVRAPEPTYDFGIGVPAVTPEPFWPLFGRLVFLRLGVAILFPIIIAIGGRLSRSSSIGGMLVGACLVGFVLGLLLYLWVLGGRYRAQNLGPLHPHPSYGPPTAKLLLLPPVILPAALLVARILYAAFASRFLGVALAGAVCLAIFYRYGGRPIRFMQELMLAGMSVSPENRRTRERFPGSPDLAKLAVVLLVVLLMPAYFANVWGILGVIVLCVLEVRRSFLPLLRFGPWRTVLAALWLQAKKVVSEYMDYAPQDQFHWQPPESLEWRRQRLVMLLASFDFAMLTGLAYYCPWEPFAAMFVPDFKTNFLLVPEYDLTNYQWLRAPLLLYQQADPRAGYLVCYVLAIILFLLLPVVVLFLVYLERLAELEMLAQDLKRAR